MSIPRHRDLLSLLGDPISRRAFLARAAAAGVGASAAMRGLSALAQADKTGVDPATWTPEYIRSIAGTLEVDTAAFVHGIVPADYAGEIDFWYAGPQLDAPQLDLEIDAQFWATMAELYPNIPLEPGNNVQNLHYNDMLDKVRTAALGNAAPDVARMPILWGVEFAAKEQLAEVSFEEFGFTQEQFWPGAVKSCMWNGKLYGIPTNNETMAFIWNKEIFRQAGLDPETPPATWDQVRQFSKQIKDATGKSGYGLVARVNAGNTPFRAMPVLWAYGSGALDEAEDEPTYQRVMINNEGGVAALQLLYDMYVTDASVPASALTNTQTENGNLFIAEQVTMVISHPSEYARMRDLAAQAEGEEKEIADRVVNNMGYTLIPEGPVRRAVVFGGSNVHILADDAVGRTVDRDAARALIATWCSPEWSVKNAWSGSNPGNLDGFKTTFMKQRIDEIPFLDVTTSMLPYGIPFPVVPESTEIMNIIVPEMLQNALTGSMSVQEAADDAAAKIQALVDQR
jgi:multiple sugar transport system substrate-binding protein